MNLLDRRILPADAASAAAGVGGEQQPVQSSKRTRGGRWTGRVIALAILGGLGAGLGAVSGSPEVESGDRPSTPAEGARGLAVETVVVTPATSFSTARDYVGTVVARRTSELSFESAGLVTTLKVDEGDVVTAGQTLAVLDTDQLLTRRRQTVARRDQAEAQLAEMIAGPREEDIDAARASVASAEAQVELLRRQTDRALQVLRQRAIAQEEADRFVYGLQSREAQLQAARHELKELLNGTRKEQISAQRALVAQLEAAIAEIDVQLRKSELRAPFSGVVSRRLVDEGAVVQAGQPLLTLVENSSLEVWVGLPLPTAQSLKADSRHRVLIEGREYMARVSRRRPEVDLATRTRTVILQLDSTAADSVVQGQIARLQLEETVDAFGFWLPVTALTEGERGLWSCLVAIPMAMTASAGGNSLVERRDVEVLHTESDRVFVRGTLVAGDHVIAAGTHRVSVGQRVRLQ